MARIRWGMILGTQNKKVYAAQLTGLVFIYFYFHISILLRDPSTAVAPDQWSIPGPLCPPTDRESGDEHFEQFKKDYMAMHEYVAF
jgi:hypothetical protein